MRLFNKSVSDHKTTIESVTNEPELDDPLFQVWNNFSDLESLENIPDSGKIYQSIISRAGIPEKCNRFRNNVLKIAAAATILLISSFLAHYYFIADRLISVMTEKGQKKEITLPDGSRIWLNADTRISYRRKFNKPVREINLSGEAYFSVVKDSARPFIVNTEQFEVKVLGTVFNIKSYPDDYTSEATLVSGSILIENKESSDKKPLLLKPTEKAVYSKTTQDISVQKVNPEKNICWKLGKLNFDNDPIEHVIKKLERWYGIRIRIEVHPEDTARLSDRYTMIINDENIEDVIRLLQHTAPFTFKISDFKNTFERTYSPEHIAPEER